MEILVVLRNLYGNPDPFEDEKLLCDSDINALTEEQKKQIAANFAAEEKAKKEKKDDEKNWDRLNSVVYVRTNQNINSIKRWIYQRKFFQKN